MSDGTWFWWALITLFSLRLIVQLSKIRKTPTDTVGVCLLGAGFECLWIWGISHYGLR
jgi:hypothetical protein